MGADDSEEERKGEEKTFPQINMYIYLQQVAF